jgi:crotonobetaine/carnitine-CoA ligase
VLDHAASAWPDERAVVAAAGTVTYAELEAHATRHASALRSLGLDRGDRVLVMLPNSLEFMYCWLGLAVGGLVQVPVNTAYKGEMLRHVIRNSRARTIIVHASFADELRAVSDSIELDRVVLVGSIADELPWPTVTLPSLVAGAGAGDADLGSVTEHDPIAIMYTSGTTGRSKGAVVTHRHAHEYAAAVVDLLELSTDDIYYAPLPLFHIAGQWAVVYAALQTGATVALRERFSVSDFWTDCRKQGVTASFLLGAMAQFLYGQPPSAEDAASPLRKVLLVPLVDGLDDFRRRFGVDVCTCYGSTESGVPIVADFGVADPAVAGRARAGYDLRLVDEHDEEVAVGEVGELVVRPDEPHVTMVEYVDAPDATSRALRNAWLHTGDAMRRDADGNFYFVDRLSDALRRRGENISSFEVEREVLAHPAVLECAAVGMPSPYTEDELVVVVALKPGETLQDDALTTFLRERAPRFMVPDRVVLIDELPKTPTGKIQKNVLRQKLPEMVSPPA